LRRVGAAALRIPLQVQPLPLVRRERLDAPPLGAALVAQLRLAKLRLAKLEGECLGLKVALQRGAARRFGLVLRGPVLRVRRHSAADDDPDENGQGAPGKHDSL
jgi:hypothetical protein